MGDPDSQIPPDGRPTILRDFASLCETVKDRPVAVESVEIRLVEPGKCHPWIMSGTSRRSVDSVCSFGSLNSRIGRKRAADHAKFAY